MSKPTLYEVLGPKYSVMEPVVEYLPGYWDGPISTERDYLVVRARSKRRAKVLALRYWRHAARWPSHRDVAYCAPREWLDEFEGPRSLNPFAEIDVVGELPLCAGDGER